MTGRLIHYSSQPLAKPESVTQVIDLDRMKPRGLWVSVEGADDWLSWCISEGFALERLIHATEVILMPGANVLYLTTPEGIDALTEEYGYVPECLKSSFIGSSFRGTMWCRWDLLAQKYQGLIIAPYIWERRLTDHTTWYYGWDCASGCIWDADAIAALVPLPAPDLKAREEAA